MSTSSQHRVRVMSGKARTPSVLLAKRLSDNKKLNVGQVHGTANR